MPNEWYGGLAVIGCSPPPFQSLPIQCSILLTEVDDTGLGGVVGSLQLGDVGNVAAHAGGGDEASVGEALELLAVDGGALPLLATEVGADGTGGEEGAIHVGVHDLVVMAEIGVQQGARLPGEAGIGDEYVEAAIQILDGGVHGGLDGLVRGDVDLVGTSWTSSGGRIFSP